MAAMMKQMATMGMRDRMKAVQQLQQGGLLDPGASWPREKSAPASGSAPKRKPANASSARRNSAKSNATKNGASRNGRVVKTGEAFQ